jgi:hypothetical protein
MAAHPLIIEYRFVNVGDIHLSFTKPAPFLTRTCDESPLRRYSQGRQASDSGKVAQS